MIKTGNPIISIYTEMTPNPETMKFVANKLLYPGKSIDFPDESSAAPSPLAKVKLPNCFLLPAFPCLIPMLRCTVSTGKKQPGIRHRYRIRKCFAENGPAPNGRYLTEKNTVRHEEMYHKGQNSHGAVSQEKPFAPS